jgi:hypothetical protein
MGPDRPLSKEERSCQKFVQEFYDWYTAPAKMDKKNPDGDLDMDDVLELKPQLLDKGLFSLIKNDRDCVATEQGICDLDFDQGHSAERKPLQGSDDGGARRSFAGVIHSRGRVGKAERSLGFIQFLL